MRDRNTGTARNRPGRWLTFSGLALLLALVSACTPGNRSGGGTIAWREVPTPTVAATIEPEPTAESPAMGGSNAIPVVLGIDDLKRVQPNELGRIPILMYHALTSDPAELDEWTVTFDTFREHLAWLYEHDFYLTPLADLINNEISVPPGKHPVVLTFDDSSSRQFRLEPDESGTLMPVPETAVGIIEAMAEAHPDFGRTALFAVVPTNCFHYAEQEASCEQRLAWLSNNGYEVANHTWWHENLHTVSDDLFRQQVGQTKIWIDERVRGDSNLGNVLILPFGEWPRSEAQVQMLFDGFVYDGQDIIIAGVVEVSGGMSPSPSSGVWTRMSINRINTDPHQWDKWTNQVETGSRTLFTSDGHPNTVSIPNQLADDLLDHWDPEWASAYGMEVIRYDLPEKPVSAEPARGVALPARRTGHRSHPMA